MHRVYSLHVHPITVVCEFKRRRVNEYGPNDQWRKPGPKFGGRKKNFAVPPNSEIWGDGEKLAVSWN